MKIYSPNITGSLIVTSSINTITGSLTVTAAFTASGLNYPSADNGEESFMQTDGNGNLSLQYVKTIYEEVVNGEATSIVKGTPVYVSGSVGAAAKVFRADAGNASKMPVIYVVADTIAAAATGRGIALGLIKGVDTTGYPAGTEIYVAVGGGWTSTRPTGSAIVQTLGYVTKEGAGGMGVILNPGPNSLPNLPAGNVWVGNSNALPVATATSSIQNVVSASFATTASVNTNGNPLIGGSITSGQVAFGTGSGVIGGDSGLTWDNVNKRLGVGTNAPTQAFDVRGKIVAQDTFPSIFVNHSGTILGGIRADGVNKLELKTLTTAPVSIQVNNSEKLRVLDTGNVLINTTTDAGFLLDVNGTARVSGNTQITGSLNVTQGITGSLLGTASYASQALSSSFATTSSYYGGSVTSASYAATASYVLNAVSASYSTQALSASFATSTSAVAGTTNYVSKFTSGTAIGNSQIFDNGTNVGIGTNAPSSKLDIFGTTTFSADAYGYVSITPTTGNGGTAYITQGTTPPRNGGNLAIRVNAAVQGGDFSIETNGSERFRILAAGNVGIGTTSPSARLHVIAPGALVTDLGLRVRNSANTGDLLLVTGNGFVQTGVSGLAIPRADTPGGTNNAIISHQTNGVVRIDKSIETSGVYGLSGFDNSQVGLALGYYGNALRCYGSATNTGFTFNTIVATTGTYFMRMQNGATDLFTILTGGSIGISNSAPKYKLDVSGSARISGETNTSISSSLVVYGSGSAQPVFTVQGSQGELFSVTDSLSGSLFSVNDISGLPIMEVFSDNTTLMGSYQDPMLITTTKLVTTASGAFTLYSLPTASYDTAFFEYSIRSGSNARAGTIMAVQLGSTVNFTETTTTDFGSTSGFGLTVQVAGANMILTGSATTSGWTIKTIVRGI
jgi:hypothetical protein